MTNRKVFIVSLGQLVESNQSASVKAFADLLVRNNKFFNWLRPNKISNFLAFSFVSLALIYDNFFSKNIDRYKSGGINSAQFKLNIGRLLGLKSITESEFFGAWNAMCHIAPAQIEKLKNTCNSLSKSNDIQILCISATNPAHLQHIQAQIKGEGENYLARLKASEHLVMCTSFVAYIHTTKVQDLVSTALELLRGEYKLVSLHKGYSNVLRKRGIEFEDQSAQLNPSRAARKSGVVAATVLEVLAQELPATLPPVTTIPAAGEGRWVSGEAVKAYQRQTTQGHHTIQ